MRTKQMFIAKGFILSVLLPFILISTGTYAQEKNQDKIHKKQPIDSVSLIASYRQAAQVQRAEYIRYANIMLQESLESGSKEKLNSNERQRKIAKIKPGNHSKGYLWINNENKSDTPEEFIVTQPNSPVRLNFDFEQSSEKGYFVVEIKDHLGKVIYSKSSQELKACRTTKNYYYRYHCLESVELDTGSYSVSLRHTSNKNSSKDIKHVFSKDNTKAVTTSEEESYYDGIMLLSFGFIGDTFSDPIDVGIFSRSFYFFDSQDITDYDDHYTGSTRRDIFYKFSLNANMDVTITHCGSTVSDSYMYLLDSAGTQIEFNNNYSGEGKCTNAYLSHIKRALSAGTYYVVSEANGIPGQSMNINITGVAPVGDNIEEPIVVGTFSSNFEYTDTKNTALYSNLYNGRPTNDVYYKFSLTRRMQITVTHCGSFVEDTYVHLLDSVGNVIVFSDDDEDGKGGCDVMTQSFIQKELSAGTYYIVSEGWALNGQIQTKIVGVVDEFGYSVMPNGYSADATGVGTVGGSMSVSPTGAAIYSVPIECPSGVGGMQPSISLVYNSQSGNGIAGYGTNISGVSAIARGPKTIYHDGTVEAIKYTGMDAFYLDGQRLILNQGHKEKMGLFIIRNQILIQQSRYINFHLS